MKIALTGAAGFVGSHLAAQFRAAGHEVHPLPFRLQDEPPPGFGRGFDLLIHAAWDFTARDDRNIRGSIRLFQQAKQDGVARILFVSSLSAFPGCRSRYGASKLAVEQAALSTSIRLGLVMDDSPRGLSGTLRKLSSLPVIPLPAAGDQRLHTIQAADLASALLRIVNLPDSTYALARPEPVTLRALLQQLSAARNPRFIPIPWRALWLPLKLAESLGLSRRTLSDSLVSLVNQNPSPDFTWLQNAGIELRKC